jgi:MFS family permease
MNDLKTKISKVPKNILVLGLVSFLNDISSEMIYPVVPIFLSTVLGVPATILGLIEGLADATANILMAISGVVSDKIHRRKVFVSLGYGFSAVSHLLMSMAYAWPTVLISRITNRAGKGIRTAARDAIITESSKKESRGLSFGVHRLMDNFGGVLGPLFAVGILALLKNDYRTLFLIAFVPTLIGVILISIFIKETEGEKYLGKKIKFEWIKTNASYKIFLLISVIFAIGNSSEAFMILRSQNLGLSVSLTILTYVLFNITNSIASLPAGLVADKIGSRKVLFVGYLIFALVYFLFGFADSSKIVWFLFPAYGVFLALTDGVAKSYISRLVPHEIVASAFGIYHTLLGVATLFASVIAGFLWTYTGPRSPFYFGSVLALIAALLFLILTKQNNLKRITS